MNIYPVNEADVNGLREVYGEGLADIDIPSTGALRVGLVFAGESVIDVDATGFLSIGKNLAGESVIDLAASLNLYRGITIEGESVIRLSSMGALFEAGTVSFRGRSSFYFHVRGYAASWSYVYSPEGYAGIEISAASDGNGSPVITLDGRPAPRARTFIVPPDPRDFVIPQRKEFTA